MTEDRARRLKDWTSYEQEMETERRQFRQEEMLRGIRDIVEGQGKSRVAEPLDRATLTCHLDEGPTRTLAPGSSNFLMTVDPRILKRRRGADDFIGLTPDTPFAQGQNLNLNRVRQCLASRNSSCDSGMDVRDH
jgi:hypothetical protein